jgi:hypothetical protein
LGSCAVCDTLKAYEKYYFGLRYVDTKGDEDWVKLEKKILKHIFPKVARKREEREWGGGSKMSGMLLRVFVCLFVCCSLPGRLY